MKRLFIFFTTTFLVFNLFGQSPKIISFSPVSGNVGSPVTITGINFSPVPSNNIVFFGSVRAQVNSASVTSLNVTVPHGASYQPITVTSNGLTAYSAVPFNLTFPSDLVLANSSFTLGSSLPSGEGPIRILTCDFNNDGKPDLANINDSANTVAFFRNTSSGNNISFASKIDIPTGNRPRGISAGDIDGDGNPDVVVGNANSNTISVYRNTSMVQGAISFASKLDFNTDTDPRGIIIADIDNDGKPDIVAITYTGGTVSILRNTSSGANISFASRVDLDLIWSSTRIIAADFNLDGNVDLAVPNGDNKPVAFFKNKSFPGTISFDIIKAGPIVSGSYNVPINIISGDIDNDGKADLVTTGIQTNIFQNISTVGGDIAFQPTQTFNRSNSLPALAMASITNDAKADLLGASGESQAVIIINANKSNFGTASFDYNSSYYNTLSQPADFAVADFNADGRIDIATANWYSRNLAVYKNIASDVGLNSFVAGYDPSSTGDIVTLYGSKLTRVENVSFGGIAADSFKIIDSSRILAYVGAGSSGNVTISSATGSASLPGFNFIPPPVLSAFSPAIAGKGDTITLTGIKFSAAHTVTFGNVPAAWFSVVNDSTILARVDTGASGNIVIRTYQGAAVKGGFVFVHSPVIYSFSPQGASPGNILTIKGYSFTGATKLVIANENISSFTIVSDSIITATISVFKGGKISITTPFGNGEIDGFYNGPVIDAVDIYAADANAVITIQGKNFGNSPAENLVRFGDAIATIVSATSNSITAKVPVGSSFGPVTVAAHHLTAYGNKSFLQTFNAPNSNLFANSFLPKQQISTTYNSMSGMDAADLDNDGKIDFVVAETSAGKILVHQNKGSSQHIGFTTSELLTNENIFYYQNVSLNDLNGDGKPEIMATSPANAGIYENTSTSGSISFLPVNKFPFSSAAIDTEVADLDGDGKPEIIMANVFGFKILENLSSPDQILFKQSAFFINFFFQDYAVKCMSIGDFNGDGKPDISISFNHGLTHVYKNISKSGNILFEYDQYILWNELSLTRQFTFDIDGDGKEDIIGTTSSDKLVVYLNISNVGNILFSPAETIKGTAYFTDLAIADFDGNGKPDIAEVSNYSYSLSITLNQSTVGAISFNDPIKINIPVGSYNLAIGDFDADEKPDISLVETNADFISIFRNRLGETLPIEICPPMGNSKIYAGAKGSSYQWQFDSGTGFVQISDNGNFTGTTTDTLRLTNIPSSWNGRKFRCLVNNQPAESFRLAFTDTWTGNIDNAWENPANWTCGVIPDENTDVIIYSGTILISQSTSIRSLTVDPSVNIHINPGVHLTILH